ncbi:MAG TPA: RNA polymerase alpha subunit C-terminal domain-containing protein [Ohtaekwangia sp.]|uniref:RNA polymerase alpha subunit C-terminal domain-containing protein n=1 Tax=Ohtaekwangia sp. TaxID=2066019 RepID=UPI002F921986
MPASKKNLRVCKNGHQYYKSSDCPTCPICEQERKPMEGFLSLIAAPARRSLERIEVKSLQELSRCTEAEIAALHGMGPNALAKLRAAMAEEGLSFKEKS